MNLGFKGVGHMTDDKCGLINEASFVIIKMFVS